MRKWLVLWLLPMVASVSAQSGKFILVLAKGEQKLCVLDYVTLETVSEIPVGEDPHEIVVSEDGSTAFVSNPVLNGIGHELHQIDLKKRTSLKTIDTAPFYTPHGLSYANGKLWFTAQGSKAVCIYDVETGKVVQVFGTGQDFTHLIHVFPDRKKFVTTNVESGTVSLYEELDLPPYMPPTGVLPANAKPRREWRQTLIDVGKGAEGFDVASDGVTLWTARPDGHVILVDLNRKKVIADLDSGVEGLHRLKFTPDGKTVCIVSVKTGDILWFDAVTRKLEQKDNIGKGAGIFMDGPANRMFVSCTPNDYLSVIDLKTRKEIKKLAVRRPDGITSATVQ